MLGEADTVDGSGPRSDETRKAFLAERLTGIGGSDSPVVLGLVPNKTRLKLWMERTGRIEEQQDNAILRRGRKMEPIVLSEYEEETGRKLETGKPAFVRSGKHPFMVGHLDAFILEVAGKDGPGVLEAKAPHLFMSSRWEDEAPLAHQVQLQHYCYVSQLKWGSIAGLLGGVTYKWQDFDRSEDFLAKLVPLVEKFWKHIQDDTPPEPEVGDAKMLQRLYAEVSGETIDLPPEAAQWDADYTSAKASQKAAEKDAKMYEELAEVAGNKIRLALKHAVCGVLPDGSGAYMAKTVSNKGYTVEPYTYRPLRRSS